VAHWEQQEFVRQVRKHFPCFFEDKRVLEVGSGEIGGTIRPLFVGGEHLGVDVSPGPAVDKVCPGQDLDEPTASFDVVLSCECFEHNPFWVETLSNMLRMLKPGGLCIVSCALLGRTEHGTRRMDPDASLAEALLYQDYYQNLTINDFERRLDLTLHFSSYFLHENIYHKDLYFVGLKRGPSPVAEIEAMTALRNSVSKIKREWKLSFGDALSARTRHALKRLFVSLLGERRLHDAKFKFRARSKALSIKLLGEQRYAERSKRRRARGKKRKTVLQSSGSV